MPVQRSTTSATCSGQTASDTKASPSRASASVNCFSRPGNDAVGQLSGAAKIAVPLDLIQFGPGTVQLLFQIARCFQRRAFGLPFRGHLGGTLQKLGQFLFLPLQPVFRGGIVFLLQRLGLNLQLQDLTVQLVKLFRLAVDLHPQTAGRFVDQVDGLVGQEAVGDVAVAQGGGRNQGAVSKCGHRGAVRIFP